MGVNFCDEQGKAQKLVILQTIVNTADKMSNCYSLREYGSGQKTIFTPLGSNYIE
jgi:hypothetical protein